MSLPPLRDYQSKAATLTHHRDRLAYFMAPRIGKSILTTDFLLARKVVRGVVSCPLSVCPQWEELLNIAGFSVIRGFKGPVADVKMRLRNRKDGILVVNDDRLGALRHDIVGWKPDAFVGDESHRFRGVSSARGKAMRLIARHTPLIRLLTGTPTPNHMGNLWGQLTAVDPDMWGRSFEKFAERYLVRDTLFPSRVLGVIRENELREMILQSAYILRREDVFGPDSWQVVDRNVKMPPKSEQVYKRLVTDWFEEISDTQSVSVNHVLKRMTRLQQLTSGYLVDEDQTVHELHSAKVDAVLADLEEIINSDEKAVIFHHFRWEGDKYFAECRKLGHEIPIVRISGDSPSEVRAEAIRTINEHPGPAIAVVQTQAGGTGISLRGATHALFVSQSFNFDDEQQARDRIFEPGARKCVTYYRVPNTVDMYVAQVLENKQNIHDAVRSADIKELAYGTKTINKRGLI